MYSLNLDFGSSSQICWPSTNRRIKCDDKKFGSKHPTVCKGIGIEKSNNPLRRLRCGCCWIYLRVDSWQFITPTIGSIFTGPLCNTGSVPEDEVNTTQHKSQTVTDGAVTEDSTCHGRDRTSYNGWKCCSVGLLTNRVKHGDGLPMQGMSWSIIQVIHCPWCESLLLQCHALAVI